MRKSLTSLSVLLMTCMLFASGENKMMPPKDDGQTMEKTRWLEMQPTVNRPDGVTILSVTTIDQSENARDDVLSQGFEGGAVPPTDWTLDNGAGTVGWEIYSTYVNSGSYSAFCNDYSQDQTTLLLSPAMDFSSETNAAVTFYQRQNFSTWYNYHEVNVYVGGTLVGLVETGAGTEDTWEMLEVDISSVAAGETNVQVGFYYSGNFADEWVIDDITVNTDGPAPPQLLISEYCDYQPAGYSGARFIEFYNPTDEDIVLGDEDNTYIYLPKYSNGNTSSYTTLLEGTVEAGDVFVVANNQDKFVEVFGFEADQYSGNISGNGDDVFALSTSGYPDDPTPNVFDILGEIGVDGTGTAWDHLDQTIMRSFDVMEPNSVWTASEWTIGAGDESFATPGSHIPDPPGDTCEDPIALTLPAVSMTGSSDGFANDYDQGGWYMSGIDVVYSFSLTEDGSISGDHTNGGSEWTGMFVYDGCPDAGGAVVASATGSQGGAFVDVAVSAGDYFLVMSNWPTPNDFSYTFNLSFTGSVPQPDFVVSSMISVDDTVFATVTNQGDGDSPGWLGYGTDYHKWSIDGTMLAGYASGPALAAGASYTFWVSGLSYDNFGEVTLSVGFHADADNDTEESDETNNDGYHDHTIAAPPEVPQNLMATAGNGLVDLDWDPAPDTGSRSSANNGIMVDAVSQLANINGLIKTVKNASVPQHILDEKEAQQAEVQLFQDKINSEISSRNSRTTGDTCEDPIALTLPAVSMTGSSDGFANDYDQGGWYMSGIDVVYSFSLTEDGSISGDHTNDGGEWTGMFVYDGCPDAGGTVVASGTGSQGGAFVDVAVSAGDYFLIMSNWPTPNDFNYTFNLSFTPGAVPQPDFVVSSMISVNDTVFATVTNQGDGDSPGYLGGGTDYHKWSIDGVFIGSYVTNPALVAGASYTFWVSGLSYDNFGEVTLSVGFHADVDNDTEESDETNNDGYHDHTITAPDYIPSYTVNRDGTSIATDVDVSEYQDTGLTNGTEYCYTVTQNMEDGSVSGESDQACATPEAPPAGSVCDNPIAYGTVNEATVSGATLEPGDAVWYSFVVDQYYDDVSVSLCDSEYDTKLEVWAACDDASYLGYNDDYCGYYSQVNLASVAAGTYYAKVYGWGDEFGNYLLTITGSVDQTAPTLTAAGEIGAIALSWEPVPAGQLSTPPANELSTETIAQLEAKHGMVPVEGAHSVSSSRDIMCVNHSTGIAYLWTSGYTYVSLYPATAGTVSLDSVSFSDYSNAWAYLTEASALVSIDIADVNGTTVSNITSGTVTTDGTYGVLDLTGVADFEFDGVGYIKVSMTPQTEVYDDYGYLAGIAPYPLSDDGSAPSGLTAVDDSENPGSIIATNYNWDLELCADFPEPFESSFTLYRDGVLYEDDIFGNSFLDDDVADATEYCYTLTENMEDGSVSDASNEACATPLDTPAGYDCEHAITATAGENSADAQPMWYEYTATLDGFITISSQNATGDAGWDTDLYVYGSCDATSPIASNDDGFGYYGPSIVTVSAQTGDVFYILWDDSWSIAPFTFTIEEELPASIYPPSFFTAVGSDQRVDLSWSYPLPPATAADNSEGGATENFVPVMGSGDYDRAKREYYRENYEGGSSRDLVGSDVTVLSSVANGDGTANITFNILIDSPNTSWADGCQLTFPEGVTISSADVSEDCGEAVIDGQTATWGDITDPETGSGLGCFSGEHQVTVTVDMYETAIDVGWYLSDDCWVDCGDQEGITTAPPPTIYDDCEDDVFEPNNDFTTPTTIIESDTLTGLTICIDDVDWYTSNLLSHESISITMVDTTGSMGLYFWDPSVSGYPIVTDGGSDTLSVSYTNLGDENTNVLWWYGVDDYYNPLAQSSYTMEVVYEDPYDYRYKVYYADGTMIINTPDYEWSVMDLVNGTEYGFYATSVDTVGNESEPTPTVFVTPSAEPLLPPENLQGEAGVNSASLTWEPPFDDTGDVIENAIEVDPTFPIELLGSTDGYTDDYDEECPSASDSPDKVYSLSPSADITVDIDLCGSGYDTKVFVYEDGHTPGAPYACDDDFNGAEDECGGAWTSMIPALTLYAGHTYYVVIDGWGGDYGDYIVNITETAGRTAGTTNPIDNGLALRLKTLALEERNANRTNDRDLLGYVVHRAIADAEFASIDTVTETAYLDTGLTADIEHHYKVSSLYTDAESDAIGPVTVVPVGPVDLPAPTNLVGVGNGWMADLSWTSPNVGGGGAGGVEDFEGGEIPEGWVMSTLADCGDFSGWFVTMDGSSAWWAIPPGDGYYAVANDDECNTDGSADYLTLPSQDFSAGGLAIMFDSFFDGAYGHMAEILVSIDGGASSTVVWTGTGQADWTNLSVDLSAYAGESDVLITFWSNDGGSWTAGWAIDNVTLGAPADFNLLGYNVYSGAEGSEEFVASTTDTSYSAFSPELATFTFSVTAVYETYGESDPSNYADVEITGPEPTCNPPRNLVAESVGNDVSLSWEAPEGGPGWNLSHHVGEYGSSVGTNAEADFSVASRFTAEHLIDYHGQALTKVQFMMNEPSASYQVRVWNAEPDGAPVLVDTSEWISGTDMEVMTYYAVELDEGIQIDWATELWIGYRVVTPMGLPAGTDIGPAYPYYGDMLLWGGEWISMSDAFAIDLNWAIEGYVDAAGGGRILSSMPEIDLSNTPKKVTTTEGTFTDWITEQGVGFPPSNTVTNTSRAMIDYIVYRNDVAIDSTGDVGVTVYDDADAPWGEHTYYVTALYDNDEECGESEPSNEVDVDLFNNPPPAVLLLQPDDGVTIAVDQSNVEDDFPFIWTSVNDPDNDPVMYVITATDDAGSVSDTAVTMAGWFPTIGDLAAPLLEDSVSVMTYSWNVLATDGYDSTASVNGPRSLTIDVSGLLALDGIGLPEVFALHNNYPNPFNPVTNISYDIPEVAQVTLEIYNVSGQKVRTLAQGQHEPGRYRIQWNATNDYGYPLSSGMYIYRIHAGDFVSVKKLILMK